MCISLKINAVTQYPEKIPTPILSAIGTRGISEPKYRNISAITNKVDNIQIKLISKIEWLLAKYECIGAPVK